jgi:hypothetical protein
VVATVYGDFENCDDHGRIRLNTAGSRPDLDGEAVDLADGTELVV